MKITIDTKEDSPEELKKVISLLSQLINEPIQTNAPQNIFDQPSPDVGNLLNIFDTPQAPAEQQQAPPEPPVKKERPEVELY